MNYFNMRPTEDNLANCLEYDCLGRKTELLNFIKLLDFPTQGFTIAIDGGWGSGKTFFVKQAISILNNSNSALDIKRSEYAERILASWAETTKQEKESLPRGLHFAAYYDAWEHDDSEDPVLSILYQLTKATGIKIEEYPNLKEIGLKLISIITDKDISEFGDLLEKGILKGEEKNDSIRRLIKEYLEELPLKKANRFDLFIDELDRCNPAYAIKLLERIKHYFDCENLTVVFSVNTKELKKTVAKYYGEGIDGIGYLDKFFDMRMTLNRPQDLEPFFRLSGMEIQSINSTYHNRICYLSAKHFQMELREIVHFIKIVNLVDSKYLRSAGEYDGGRLLHMLLAPILIANKMKVPEEYEKCINGEDAHHIVDIIVASNDRYYLNLMKENDEAFEWDRADDKKAITREEKIKQLYNTIFPVDKMGSWKQIGEIVLYKEHVENLLKTCNLLSGNLSFDSL